MIRIGKQLKALRKAKKMTLYELSQKTGVQTATLSRIENDVMTGTLESHLKICKALGTSLSDFYREVENEHKIVSLTKGSEKDERPFVHTRKSITELLAPKAIGKKLLPLLIKIQKGGQTQKEQNAVGTEKFAYLLSGKILAKIGKNEYHLSKSDSIYFDATLPHIFCNTAKTEAHILCIQTKPSA